MLIQSVASSEIRRAEDVNQLSRALRNVLGMTDSSQDAVGRLVLPSATVAPSGPVVGRTYYDRSTNIWWVYDGTAWQRQKRIYQQIYMTPESQVIPVGSQRAGNVMQGIITLVAANSNVWVLGTAHFVTNIPSFPTSTLRDVYYQVKRRQQGEDDVLVYGPVNLIESSSLAVTGNVVCNAQFFSFIDSPTDAGTYTYVLEMATPYGFGANPTQGWGPATLAGILPAQGEVIVGNVIPISNMILLEI